MYCEKYVADEKRRSAVSFWITKKKKRAQRERAHKPLPYIPQQSVWKFVAYYSATETFVHQSHHKSVHSHKRTE